MKRAKHPRGRFLQDPTTSVRVLCVHGVGDHHSHIDWQRSWREAIERGLRAWAPNVKCEFQFVMYDKLFTKYRLGPLQSLKAALKLGWSGIVHGIIDTNRPRGLFDIPGAVRWTAGMVVQWVENEELRAKTTAEVLRHTNEFNPHLICAHSLGSLICYDTFVRTPGNSVIEERKFISFGSQIGNPLVRSMLGGRIAPLKFAHWYHLYNSEDAAFTSSLRIFDERFSEVSTPFDIPGPLDHAAEEYLSHPNTGLEVWRQVVTPPREISATRTTAPVRPIREPRRRALLVGINDYPREALRLEGCVNDTFRVSAALQEGGIPPEEIRVVLNDRATASGIMERLRWLLDDAQQGDECFFYYSGHGAQIPQYGAEGEVDRLDECLVPYDFDWTLERAVTDDQFYELYSQLPYEMRFVTILDCCHSGGMTRAGGVRVRGLDPPDDIRHRYLRWNPKLKAWDQRPLKPLLPLMKDPKKRVTYTGNSGCLRRLGRAVQLRSLPTDTYNRERKRASHEGPYLPIILQACREDQYSFEYRFGPATYGAFTFALTKFLSETRGSANYEGLLEGTCQELARLRFDQDPCLVGPKAELINRVSWLPKQ